MGTHAFDDGVGEQRTHSEYDRVHQLARIHAVDTKAKIGRQIIRNGIRCVQRSC